MARPTDKLTAIAVKNAKPKDSPYKLADGGGMYLLVNPDGSKYWRLAYRHAGKQKLLALGVYPEISLLQARAKRDEARSHHTDGKDPGLVRKQAKQRQALEAANTFKAMAYEWHHRHYANLTEKQGKRVWAGLERLVFPHIGAIPVNSLTSPDFVSVLRKLEAREILETAHRIAGQMVSVMDFATAAGLCEMNTAEAARRTLKPKPPTNHFPAFTKLSDAGIFLRQLRNYDGDILTLHGIRLLLLTSVRTGELRFATWDEIDFAESTWTIPNNRTKNRNLKERKSHIVHLSRQALQLFQELRQLSKYSEYVFAKPTKSGTLSENFCTQAIKRMGFQGEICGHGFRGTLSTILNEDGHFRPDVIERALSHEERNSVRAAYNHATYERELRELWQWWADALESAENPNQ